MCIIYYLLIEYFYFFLGIISPVIRIVINILMYESCVPQMTLTCTTVFVHNGYFARIRKTPTLSLHTRYLGTRRVPWY